MSGHNQQRYSGRYSERYSGAPRKRYPPADKDRRPQTVDRRPETVDRRGASTAANPVVVVIDSASNPRVGRREEVADCGGIYSTLSEAESRAVEARLDCFGATQ